MKQILIFAALLLLTTHLQAQVTVGNDKTPETFSILELIAESKGMRLPQLTTDERTALSDTHGLNPEMKGLSIYNKTIDCVEYWNGTMWVAQCDCGDHPCPKPIIVIPDEKGGDTWTTTQWVGAFWRDNQTGERIIASKNNTAWSASVDDPSGVGSWLVLEANGGTDPALWTDAPHDAESYQVSGSATTVSGSGDILFRIGATSTNPNATDAAYKYPNGSNGKAPRYATITLTVGTTDYKLFCRQGESADYVFTPTDTYNDPNHTDGTNILRSLAKKFSPYNLTGENLNDDNILAYSVGARGGSFIDFPTKAGAFFQWSPNNNITYAYHPTQPNNVPVGDWSTYFPFTYWDILKTTHETCPNGWRRPNDGVTNAAASTPSDLTADYTQNNIYKSEMRQSLYAVPKNGTTAMPETTGRAWGYYADGYFDRRPIVTGVGTSPLSKSAVSKDTKDVAYIGTLFFNAANGNRSLFAPAGGYRGISDGSLYMAGDGGCYWSSSAYGTYTGWDLYFYRGFAVEYNENRSSGFAVRCVAE
jgi:hypothetical protein